MSIYLDTSLLRRGITADIIDKQNKLIRESKGRGRVLGFGAPDDRLSFEVDEVVEGVSEFVTIGEKIKDVTPHSRVVSNGSTQFIIEGNLGDPIYQEDIYHFLQGGDKKAVTVSLDRNRRRKIGKLTNATKS